MAENAKKTPAQLDAGILVRKGAARPVGVPEREEEPAEPSPMPRGTKNTVAVTVRLDEARYRKLVAYGAEFYPRRTNQDILVEALDEYLARVARE